MPVKQLVCPSCGAQIRGRDLSIVNRSAKCPKCSTEFNLLDILPPDAIPPELTKALEEEKRPVEEAAQSTEQSVKSAVTLPKGVRVEETLRELRIHRRWFGIGTIVFLIFGAIWNGFIVVLIATAIREKVWVIGVFIFFHVVIGIIIAYRVLAGFLNTTTIRVNANGFDVRHGPIPVPGINRLVPGRLDQVYCKERIIRSKNSTTHVYDVIAAIKEGKDVEIIKTLHSLDEARYIEQVVEKYLNLADRPMPDEKL